MTGDPEKPDEDAEAAEPVWAGEAPSRPPPPPEEDARTGEKRSAERRKLFERVVPELVKRVVERAVETGIEKLAEQPENIKNFVSELRLPKEVISDVYAQVDDTKNGIYRVVAKEIRDVLEQTQFADEIAKVLTKLSFEIKTEIRFVPNDRAAEGREGEDASPKKDGDKRSTLPRPSVTSEVTLRDRTKDDRKDAERAKDAERTKDDRRK